MDNRIFYIVGDLVASALTGAVVGLLCAWLVGESWPVLAAMITMMALGMVMGVFLFFPMGIAFGAMEVMIPMMLAGILAGMVAGVWGSMQALSLAGGAFLGMQTGLCALLLVWIANTLLRGEQSWQR